jgi:hypothetical protein
MILNPTAVAKRLCTPSTVCLAVIISLAQWETSPGDRAHYTVYLVPTGVRAPLDSLRAVHRNTHAFALPNSFYGLFQFD